MDRRRRALVDGTLDAGRLTVGMGCRRVKEKPGGFVGLDLKKHKSMRANDKRRKRRER